jgi:hypothetical protein
MYRGFQQWLFHRLVQRHHPVAHVSFARRCSVRVKDASGFEIISSMPTKALHEESILRACDESIMRHGPCSTGGDCSREQERTQPVLFTSGRTQMSKYPKAWLVAACVVASGAAFAQAGGGNGNSGNGGGQAHGAATAAPTAGNEPASNATGSMAGSTSSSMKHHQKKSKANKPMTDTTNTPGANASSDTKGQ